MVMIDSFRLVVAMDKEELVKLEEEASSRKQGLYGGEAERPLRSHGRSQKRGKSKRLTQTWREPQRDLRSHGRS